MNSDKELFKQFLLKHEKDLVEIVGVETFLNEKLYTVEEMLDFFQQALKDRDALIEPVYQWGALWHSKNRLDGLREHIIYNHFSPALFRTKKEAREFIKQRYGYIAKRKDLREEPHGWRMPKIIKLKISVVRSKP